LAFYMHGYNDGRVLKALIFVGAIFMVLGSYQYKGDKHD